MYRNVYVMANVNRSLTPSYKRIQLHYKVRIYSTESTTRSNTINIFEKSANYIIKYKKLATIVSDQRNVTRPFVWRK